MSLDIYHVAQVEIGELQDVILHQNIALCLARSLILEVAPTHRIALEEVEVAIRKGLEVLP
jgi:hypothetical protein